MFRLLLQRALRGSKLVLQFRVALELLMVAVPGPLFVPGEGGVHVLQLKLELAVLFRDRGQATVAVVDVCRELADGGPVFLAQRRFELLRLLQSGLRVLEIVQSTSERFDFPGVSTDAVLHVAQDACLLIFLAVSLGLFGFRQIEINGSLTKNAPTVFL